MDSDQWRTTSFKQCFHKILASWVFWLQIVNICSFIDIQCKVKWKISYTWKLWNFIHPLKNIYSTSNNVKYSTKQLSDDYEIWSIKPTTTIISLYCIGKNQKTKVSHMNIFMWQNSKLLTKLTLAMWIILKLTMFNVEMWWDFIHFKLTFFMWAWLIIVI